MMSSDFQVVYAHSTEDETGLEGGPKNDDSVDKGFERKYKNLNFAVWGRCFLIAFCLNLSNNNVQDVAV